MLMQMYVIRTLESTEKIFFFLIMKMRRDVK